MSRVKVNSKRDKNIYAQVIADSVNTSGQIPESRITTLELQYHRFIHCEFLTHRMFSRNSSSSRAIPVNKTIDNVENTLAYPLHWGRSQKGMQAQRENDSLVEVDYAQYTREQAWEEAALASCDLARSFAAAGYHKQIVNRLLEPYSYIKTVVTATEWENFFNLRLHADAQPEIQELANVMDIAISASEPEEIGIDKWHLPYLTRKDKESGYDAPTISAARCARVSYLNHDKSNPDYEADMRLGDKLLNAGHMSPFEHQATPMSDDVRIFDLGVTHRDNCGVLWSGNFKDWLQYRQFEEDLHWRE